MLAKFILMMIILISLPAASIGTMIYGWGINPENWPIIILGLSWQLLAPMLAKGITE